MITLQLRDLDRPMLPPQDQSRHPADLLEYEFGQEKASALGRLGRALEAKLAALAEFDASHGAGTVVRRRTAIARVLWSPRQASRSGISSCSAKPAGCATCARCCATTACRRRLRRAWASCHPPRAAKQADRLIIENVKREHPRSVVRGAGLHCTWRHGGRPLSAAPVSSPLEPDRISLRAGRSQAKESALKGDYA